MCFDDQKRYSDIALSRLSPSLACHASTEELQPVPLRKYVNSDDPLALHPIAGHEGWGKVVEILGSSVSYCMETSLKSLS